MLVGRLGVLRGVGTSRLLLLSFGRLSKIHAFMFIPDPGDLNSCMHAFLENTWVYYGLTHDSVFGYGI